MTDEVAPRDINKGQHEAVRQAREGVPQAAAVSGGSGSDVRDDMLRVEVPGASDLHHATHQALATALAKHGRDLLNEASRLEAAANPGLAVPVITPGMIHDAETLQRIGYAQAGKAVDRRNWMLGSLAATFVGGFFTNNLTEPWGAVGFVVCGALALIFFNKGSQS
ncbi:hypothetical protein ACIBP4_07450 [Micromonospora maritima]|uniref:DUF2335 domain-containing protein n=1 Tax=Micromonospora maritima TaxID=986711 RepID=A0ABW7ZH03_9ACTN